MLHPVKRIQIYLEEETDEQLRALSAARGRSAASIVREALRRYLVDERATATGLSRLRGLGKEAWRGIDADRYVDRLRREWPE